MKRLFSNLSVPKATKYLFLAITIDIFILGFGVKAINETGIDSASSISNAHQTAKVNVLLARVGKIKVTELNSMRSAEKKEPW